MEKETMTHQKGGSFLLQSTDPMEVFTPEDFTDQQKMIEQTTSDFVDNEVMPKANEIDDQKEGMSVSLLKKAGELGLLSIDIPEEYGGMGLDKTSSMLVAENIGRTGAWAVSHGAHTGIGTLPIVYFGTEEQKKKYLPKFATGEWISSYSLSEPGSGSDALSARTTAKLTDDGKHYLLMGPRCGYQMPGLPMYILLLQKLMVRSFHALLLKKIFLASLLLQKKRKWELRAHLQGSYFLKMLLYL